MNIVLAPDSFKGSITALEAASIMKRAIHSQYPNDNVLVKPMADGGEGTVDVVLASVKNGRRINITCTGPLGGVLETYYGVIDKQTAIIEVANIAGLMQVPKNRRNPDDTTTYGVGEVMLDAIDRGCTTLIIGLGGSATNDGGLGMLQALGMMAWNQQGEEAGIFGQDLHTLNKIDTSKMDTRLEGIRIKVACDVNSPLCGVNGATKVYGRQKGATEEQIMQFDESLKRFKTLIQQEERISAVMNADQIPGSGAAGGLGFTFLGLGAELVSGSKFITEITDMENVIKQADLVITGEGQSDEQTLYGKAPAFIADVAKKYEVPTVLLSGAVTGDRDALSKRFSGCFSIINEPLSLNKCMADTAKLLYQQTKQLISLIHQMKQS